MKKKRYQKYYRYVLFFCQFFALVIFIIIVNKKLPLSKAKKEYRV
jgi:hypothetical protein